MMFQLLLPLFETDNKKKQAGFLILSAALGMLVGFTPDTDNFMAMSRVFVFLPFYLWDIMRGKTRSCGIWTDGAGSRRPEGSRLRRGLFWRLDSVCLKTVLLPKIFTGRMRLLTGA